MLSYQELIHQMNQSMLAAESDRVALLRYILDQLGHPESKYHIVHIVGTNGKGSTGTLVGNLLMNSGEKVGHFASPAIHDDREQILLQNQMISETNFVTTYEKIMAKLTVEFDMSSLSIFEWFVIIMLQYFADQEVTWAIIEAGLGGKLDATNAINAPLLTIITHVDLDHTAILGNTIKMIAYNKSDVIKQNTTVFMAPNQTDDTKQVMVNQVIERNAKELIDSSYVSVKIQRENLTGFDLQISSHYLDNVEFHFDMLGEFQIDNLQTVIAVYDWLVQNNFGVGLQSLKETLTTTKIEGRMQVINHQPTVILDAAHNPDSTKRLISSLKHLYPTENLKFILGFLQDKNYLEMAKLYHTISKEIVVVTPNNSKRALSASRLQKEIPGSQIASNAQIGLETLIKQSGPNDVIVVTGSFYTIKEIEA